MISQFSGAGFDKERRYRFIAWRLWDERPRVLFVGLNPSTADEYENDPTVRRCIDFAQRWGYGGLYMCNVFAYRATYPNTLPRAEAVHPAYIPAIEMARKLSDGVVAAWGDGVEQVNTGTIMAGAVVEIIAPYRVFWIYKKRSSKTPFVYSGECRLSRGEKMNIELDLLGYKCTATHILSKTALPPWYPEDYFTVIVDFSAPLPESILSTGIRIPVKEYTRDEFLKVLQEQGEKQLKETVARHQEDRRNRLDDKKRGEEIQAIASRVEALF